ncbi:transcription-repair coupling factor [Desulfurobacterium thermolithotrophum DSM 11699]|uniref:Transcription-repair-coupling factor n=1 Tax=Desulfurobacterium thermolithotrophum (strain DSM 11699 / BSA) TaxID=868864 RepID=F0S455_DESTD|nr:transcription-repair coupling factor [Desulfurobacterium thermolithotrophum]ADY73627.1 transcription-repair coupling factor [Desulfurobacterium thermolithotrophum DSM 11699]
MIKRSLKLLKGKVKNKELVKCYGLPGGSKGFILKEIKELISSFLFLVPSEVVAESIIEDLKRFGLRVIYLPAWDVPPLDISSPLSLYQYRRLKSLYQLLSEPFNVLLLTPHSLFQKVILPENLIEYVIEIEKGKEIDYSLIPKKLTTLGYKRVDSEPEEGEFSIKGDTLELVSPEGERLVAEFFGDTVEELYLNKEIIEKFVIIPTLELLQDREKLKKLEEIYPGVVERHFLLGEISGAEKLLPDVFELVPVTEYIGGTLPAIVFEPDQVRTTGETFIKTVEENFELLKKEGIPSSKPEKFVWKIDIKPIVSIYDKPVKDGIDFGIKPLPSVNDENIKELFKSLEGFKVKLFYTSETLKIEAEKLSKKFGLDIQIEKGVSSGSFKIDERKEAWLTESEVVFETAKKEDITTLEPGTLVVHRDYGIGIFQGIISRVIGNKTFDFIEIEYAGGERLYAPFTQIDRIYKYSGYKGKSPKLDKLGGTSWKNLERKIKASLINFAKELAELYKERKSAKGEKILGDENLLREFERRFPYKPTPDQLKAIREVYKDMESEKPMDRLICGDVGFGKTEVAMRAAMKAVTDGRQVAVIVPTTILADQHYRTFKKRFKGFPVKIEAISRFKTKKEQKEILEKLKNGEIDIIIGTHRLTQDDVEFKNLGLLIIDEEHRFGVKTKEKLTKIKKNLDVLYLSATPIPRTLYSALSGFRDISVIETPPVGRRGTKVVVSKYSDRILKTAVERELKRNGQVFIVQNDIDELEPLKIKVEEMFPNIPVDIVHGQMKTEKIEKVMHKFFEGDIKILIATSIIESGLDIPSANTLIVIGAERFGLSQLYQLRGRVGRGIEKGYCYLLTSSKGKLTPEAVKRLEAMKKVSPVGGGFQLAMKDLEIRGAGTLLGPKQSGFVNTIGLDLYLKLFEEVTTEKEEEDVKITVPFEAFIPEDYIEDTKERLRIYGELSKSENPEEILSEIEKVHGAIPDPLVNIFKIMKIKKLAKEIGIKEITMTPSGRLVIVFGESPNILPEKLVEFVKSKDATFTPDKKLYMEAENLDKIIEILEEMMKG